MSIFDEICGGWSMSSLGPPSSRATRRRTKVPSSKENREGRSEIAKTIRACRSDLSDEMSWASTPSRREERRDDMHSMFDAIRRDRMREEAESKRLFHLKRAMTERREDLLKTWENQRQSIMCRDATPSRPAL